MEHVAQTPNTTRLKAGAAGLLFTLVGVTLQHWIHPAVAAFVAGVLMSVFFRLLPPRVTEESVARAILMSLAAGLSAGAAVWAVTALLG